MAKARVLIIDDEESPRESLRYILKNLYEVVTKTDGASGVEALRHDGPFDVALLDMKMPGMNGLETLAKLLEHTPGLPVIMVTAITDAKPAVQAMKMGAADYLNKPFDVEEIRLVVNRVLKERDLRCEVGRLKTELASTYKFEHIVGTSPAMQVVYDLVRRIVDTDTTVLVTGETGTGKELIARALHFNSVRKDEPFIPVHCAAIPSELLESELFGHEKGSFTGALQRRIGMFEAAHGGTLFLDEIGEMAHGTQAKLLRSIQEREIRRVGSQETITINVRLVCATNRNLAEEVKQGRFREDLFYRINVVPVELPALRARKEDIPTLVQHFVERFAKEFKRVVPQITPAAMNTLVNYPWPGNVRELQHAMERLIVTGEGDRIGVEHLPFVISQAETDGAAVAATRLAATVPRSNLGEPAELAGEIDLPKLTEKLERKAIEEALRRADGVITEAARALNITRRMLRYKIDKLGIAVKPQPTDEEIPDAPSESVPV
jgi:DNA-binding NtrC family response regulator